MRTGRIALWAMSTLVLTWVLFAITMPLYNRENNSGAIGRAYASFLIPLIGQVVWFAVAAIYTASSKRREPFVGIKLGFGLEFVALMVLVVISASARY